MSYGYSRLFTIVKLDGRTVRSLVLPRAYEIDRRTGIVYEHAVTTRGLQTGSQKDWK